MSEVKTFRAATMQEALDLVRRELGGDAVILHTRQVETRKGFLWRKAKEEVEITAGLGINVPPRPARPAAAENGRPGGMSSAEPRPSLREPSPRASTPSAPRPAVNRLTTTTGAGPSPSSDDADVFLSDSLKNALAQARRPTIPPSDVPAARAPHIPAYSETAEAAVPSPAPSPELGPLTADFSRRLDMIQKMLEKLGQSSPLARRHEIPDELFHAYTLLIDQDVEDELARELIFRLKSEAATGEFAHPESARAALAGLIAPDIRCCGPIAPRPGRRKVVALVGSTGVGKTTTIAKLAANFRLRDGIRMGLVTVDTYRIAAVEQLRTYAEIIDLPMKVVTNPLEMRRAMEELAGLDLVLIDTAGRSPRDDLQIQELKRLFAEARVDEVHLVMSLTASLKSITTTAEKFAPAGATAMILTKLDEAAGLGTLLSLARRVPLPVSYLTTGQDVPDDIEPAHASRMARLILGQDQLAK